MGAVASDRALEVADEGAGLSGVQHKRSTYVSFDGEGVFVLGFLDESAVNERLECFDIRGRNHGVVSVEELLKRPEGHAIDYAMFRQRFDNDEVSAGFDNREEIAFRARQRHTSSGLNKMREASAVCVRQPLRQVLGFQVLYLLAKVSGGLNNLLSLVRWLHDLRGGVNSLYGVRRSFRGFVEVDIALGMEMFLIDFGVIARLGDLFG